MDPLEFTVTNPQPLEVVFGGTQGPAGPAGATIADLQSELVTLRGLGATMTYTGGRLTSVAYADGSSKSLSYTGDKLTQVDTVLVNPNRTYRRTLAYTGDNLTSVTDVLL